MRNNRLTRLAAILLAITLMMSVSHISVFAADGEAKLTIIHVNDRHGRTTAEPYVSQIAKDWTAFGENVLILDAGDSLHGQTPANLSKGEVMVDIMNEVGYSAMVPGNHDFNFGVDRLVELSKKMKFPVLAANVNKNGENLFEAYKIFEIGGLKAGVFGLATPETVTKSDPRVVAGLTFEDPVKTAEAMVKKLKEEKCDVIIALTHLGVDEASEPKNRSDALTAVAGIDVVIDGHSHTLLENGKVMGDMLIAQTGAFTENIGIVEISVKDGKVSKTAGVVPLPKEDEETTLAKDETIVKKIAEEEAKIEPITGEIVGTTPVVLQGEREFVRKEETNLSNMITDSMKYATNSDIAFLTGGNIRASIDAGDITMGEVLTTLPFSNLLATVEISGKDMLEVLEHGVSKYPELAGQYIQVSGIKFEFDPEAEPMQRVKSVTMADGSPFDTAKTYTVCTIDFITAGGDGYEMMTRAANKTYYQGDAEAFVAYLETKPDIKAEPEGRVTTVTASAPQAQASPKQEEAAPAPPQAQPVQPEPSQPAPVTVQEGGEYIVKPGDNLTKIAETYGITWRELHKLNSGIKDPNLIYPGQKLIVPAMAQIAS